MKKDRSEPSTDVNGVDENGITVETILAKIEPNSDPNLEKQLKKSQRMLPTSLSEVKKESSRLQNLINKENERISGLGKEEILNEIMKRLEADAQGEGVGNIDLEDIHTIGVALIKNFCSINAAANELGLMPARLRYLIVHSDELQVYYQIAHEAVKGLTDEQVIKGLKVGDENIIKMVFQKMYAGRNKGGYNIAELGTIGYNDPLAQQLAAATEDDRRQSQVKVEFNFVQQEVRSDFQKIEAADDVLEGEYEMVKEDENENNSTESKGE
jgi:hypothetical protein